MSVCWYTHSLLLSPALFQPILMTLRKHSHPFMDSFIHPGDLETGELSSVSVNSSLLEIQHKWNNTLMTFCACLSSLGSFTRQQVLGLHSFSQPNDVYHVAMAMSCLSIHWLIRIWVVHCDYWGHEHWCTYVWMPRKVDDGRNEV